MKRLLFAIAILAMLSPSLYAQDTTRNHKMHHRNTEQRNTPGDQDQNRSKDDSMSDRKKNKKNKKNQESGYRNSDTASYRR